VFDNLIYVILVISYLAGEDRFALVCLTAMSVLILRAIQLQLITW